MLAGRHSLNQRTERVVVVQWDVPLILSHIPNVGLPSREWEFATHVLTVAQVVDGVTLVKVLKEAAAEGWDLSDVVDGGDKRVLLMRRPKRGSREMRRVGFAPPSMS